MRRDSEPPERARSGDPAGVADFHVVVRCSGERTESVARRLVRAQVESDEDISAVSEAPFEAALRAAYAAGIRAGRDWTITLDADVLLEGSAIARLLEHARQMPKHFLQLEGLVYDKLMGVYRQAGHRVYRTELLPAALREIPPTQSQLRPESSAVQRMGRLGHPSRYVSCVVGLHDHEQSYRDLYRKGVVHARKWSPLLPGLVRRCQQHMQADPDFLVLLKGLWDGLVDPAPVSIDRRLFTASACEALRALGIGEKDGIDDESAFVARFPAMFGEITSQHPACDATIMDKPRACDPPEPRVRSWRDGARARIAQRGLLRGGVACLGALLRRLGNGLDPQDTR